ncbi:MAG: O-antigen ligase family protein [Cetobacterium sp.]
MNLQKIKYYSTEKSSKIKIYMYMTLSLSYLNTVLRLTEGSSLTLFRLFLPFTLVAILCKNPKSLFKNIFYLIIFCTLSLFLSERYFFIKKAAFIQRINSLTFLSFYIMIGIVYLVIQTLKKIEGMEFKEKFYSFLYKFNCFTIMFTILQWLFKFNIPNTTSYRNTGLTAFYWTENEVSVVLASFFPFLLMEFIDNKKRKKNLILIILSLMIIYYNDSKIVLIGTIFQITLYFLFSINLFKKIFFIINCIFLLLVLISNNLKIQFSNSSLSIYEMLAEPIYRIVNLKPYGDTYGSITNRTDVLIYGIKEIFKNFFIGIGPGNSIYFIENLGIFGSLKSPHNFLLQIILEYGFISLILIMLVVCKIVKILIKKNKSPIEKVFLVFSISFPVFSLGSSAGFYSLYFVFSVIFYLILSDELKNVEKLEYNKKQI